MNRILTAEEHRNRCQTGPGNGVCLQGENTGNNGTYTTTQHSTDKGLFRLDSAAEQSRFRNAHQRSEAVGQQHTTFVGILHTESHSQRRTALCHVASQCSREHQRIAAELHEHGDGNRSETLVDASHAYDGAEHADQQTAADAGIVNQPLQTDCHKVTDPCTNGAENQNTKCTTDKQNQQRGNKITDRTGNIAICNFFQLCFHQRNQDNGNHAVGIGKCGNRDAKESDSSFTTQQGHKVGIEQQSGQAQNQCRVAAKFLRSRVTDDHGQEIENSIAHRIQNLIGRTGSVQQIKCSHRRQQSFEHTSTSDGRQRRSKNLSQCTDDQTADILLFFTFRCIVLNLCSRGLSNQYTHFIINSRDIVANNDLELTALTNRTLHTGNRFDLFCVCHGIIL